MISTILFSLFLVSASASPSLSPSIEELIARFPQDDVVILEHETHITLEPNGTSLRRERMITMPLTLAGREDYSDIRLPYYAPSQVLTIHRCVVKTENGTTIDAEPHAFNPVTPDGYAMAPDFLAFREMVISPPGIAEGTTLELIYSIRDSVAICPWWEAELDIAQTHPVMNRIICVENQSGFQLQWRILHAETTEGSKHGSKGMTWSFENLPASPTYGIGPNFDRRIPRLQLSTCPSWESLSSWACSSMSMDSLSQEPVDSLKTLFLDAVTRVDSVEAVIGMTEAFMRLVPSPDRRFWICRSAHRLMETGYAEPWEHAAFTYALLWAVGIRGSLHLVGAPLPGDALPMVSQFRGMQIHVPGRVPLWIHEGKAALWPSGVGAGTILPLIPYHGTPELEPGKGPFTGSVLIQIRGIGADTLWIGGEVVLSAALIPEEAYLKGSNAWLNERLGTMEERFGEFSIRALRMTTAGMHLVFSGGVHLSERVELNSDIRHLFGDAWLPPRSMPHQSPLIVPIHIPESIDLTVDLRILPHESWNLFLVEENEAEKDELLEYSYNVSHDPGKLTIRQHFRLSRGWMNVSEQMRLRRLLGRMAQLGYRTMLIEG